jgi:hypothetical protein
MDPLRGGGGSHEQSGWNKKPAHHAIFLSLTLAGCAGR